MILSNKPKSPVTIIRPPDSHILSDDVKSKTAILVPVGSYIEPACDQSLRSLEKDGIKVIRHYGFSAIDQGRCVMAQNAINDGYEHLFWIDSDMAFCPQDVCRIINNNHENKYPFVTAAYSIKGWPRLTTKFSKNYETVVFGEKGALYEVDYAATGFMYTNIRVYEDIKLQYDMKPVKIWGGQYQVHPWFLPMIIGDEYVGEDFSFCYRAKKSGHTIYSDTTVRLAHIGKYSYSHHFLTQKGRLPCDEPNNIIYYKNDEPATTY